MPVKIKSFGRDSFCDSPKSLANTLLSDYKNSSVTIVSTTASGTRQTTFVDVLEDGTIIDSYTNDSVPLSEFFR